MVSTRLSREARFVLEQRRSSGSAKFYRTIDPRVAHELVQHLKEEDLAGALSAGLRGLEHSVRHAPLEHSLRVLAEAHVKRYASFLGNPLARKIALEVVAKGAPKTRKEAADVDVVRGTDWFDRDAIRVLEKLGTRRHPRYLSIIAKRSGKHEIESAARKAIAAIKARHEN